MIFQNNRDPFAGRMFYFKSGGGDSYDPVYNARMATIAEAQQRMADNYFKFWESDYKPMEEAQIAANMEMIPIETDLNKAKMAAEKSLLPGQTNLAIGQTEAAMKLLPQQTQFAQAKMADETTAMQERAPVRAAFYQGAMDGVDVEGRANKAAADAAHAFVGSQAAMSRDAARMGVNPNSGRFASMRTSNSISRAKAIGGAKTQARTQAENENFGRLNTAMQYGG